MLILKDLLGERGVQQKSMCVYWLYKQVLRERLNGSPDPELDCPAICMVDSDWRFVLGARSNDNTEFSKYVIPWLNWEPIGQSLGEDRPS